MTWDPNQPRDPFGRFASEGGAIRKTVHQAINMVTGDHHTDRALRSIGVSHIKASATVKFRHGKKELTPISHQYTRNTGG